MAGLTVPPFGILLKELRERARLSQPQLAERSGLSKGYVGGIEAGLRGKRPSRDTILALARALDVPPLEMLVATGRDAPADHGERGAVRPSFQQLVKTDPLLKTDERDMLIKLYESYVGKRAPR
jgi:transcriptional regulator with XRE-family HTH domain